jgi:putative oxidoreductase
MFWVVLVARVLVGLPFFVLGLDHFLHVLPMPTPPAMPENAMKFGGALGESGYLNVVKVLEAVGGALILSGRLVPLGLVLVTPVAVNILLFEIFLMGQPGLGVVLAGLCFFLVWAYRSHFAGVFAIRPKIG